MMMAESYGVFASYLQFKEVLSDPLGHLYRAGEFDASGVRRAAWLRVFDQPAIEGFNLEEAFNRAHAIADAVQSVNVPSGLDCILEGDAAAMAIDYTPSQPLSLVLARVAREQFPVPVDNALLIAEKIALALSATLTVEIQGGRVVHGFLHPSLIFVTNDGEALVSGFGIATRLLTVLDDPSSADTMHPYFAPEVLHSRAASARGDVYSIGAILFHLLTGSTLPTVAEDRRGAIDGATMAFEEEPLPDDIKNLLRRALAEQPEARFSSSADFKKELDRLLYGGAYSPTTFNLALFMDRLFRPEIEVEEEAVARELGLDVTPYVRSVLAPKAVIEIQEPDRPSPLKYREVWIGLGVLGVAAIVAILWLTVFRGPSTPPPSPTPTAEEIATQRQQQEEKMRELAAGLVAEMMAEKEEEIRQELLARQAKIDELQRRLAASERRAQQGPTSDDEAIKREQLQRQIAAEEKARRHREAELEAERLQAAEDVRLQAVIQQTATAAAQMAASAFNTPNLPPMPSVVPTAGPTSVPTPRTESPPPIEENTFFDPADVDSPPAIIKEVSVIWPRAALSSRRKGVVVLQVTVDANGTAEDLRIMRADHEGFGIPQAVKEAVTKYRFKAGTKNGVRIKTYLSIVARYDFTGR